jgi:hypothetical protein
MVKRALFITVVCLMVSTVAFASSCSYSCSGKGNISQFQSTSVVVSNRATVCGTGIASSTVCASAAGCQAVPPAKPIAVQVTKTNVRSNTFASAFWGKANAYVHAVVTVVQNQFWR